jgi:hypothetical protein
MWGSIPYTHRYLDFPVKSPGDWEPYKRKFLNIDEPGRFDPQWQAAMRRCMDRGRPISFGDWRELGLLDCVAAMIGTDACLQAMRSARTMIVDMLDHFANMYMTLLGRVLDAGVRVDMFRLSDSGDFPKLGPDEFRRLCGEPLWRIANFVRGRGIPILASEAPSYGLDIVPAWMESGINCLLGVAKEDITTLREDFPRLCVTGGIDLRDLNAGRDAIDACLRRVREWLPAKRFIPEIEWIPFMPWQDFEYLAQGLQDALGVQVAEGLSPFCPQKGDCP